ncbi:MAG: MotA/TolQ/ExbB proton channel family protein [Bdellovibrionaceae bacterium]|nr:MotA/TolQ/ExbB proton channel family protein [Pseudobdellovibrionaceae bacterium]
MAFFTNIIASFGHGGFVMWIILLGQIFSIAIIVERVYALYVSRSLDNKKVAKQFEEDIKKGKLESVIAKAQKLSQHESAIGKVIVAGAQAAYSRGGSEEIQSKMDEVLLAEASVIEKRTGFLAAIGNIGTLAGLLGTIIGLIDSFAAVSTVNPAEKAALLSQGISMAMYATAYGLLVAIPALAMFAVLQNRANSVTEDVNQTALMVYNWLTYSYEPVQKKTARQQD